jgi:hypothetical protein
VPDRGESVRHDTSHGTGSPRDTRAPQATPPRHEHAPHSLRPTRPPYGTHPPQPARRDGFGAGSGDDPPLYRALLARWAERGATLPLCADPEWERLTATPAPWCGGHGRFSGPRDPAGGGR